MPTPPLNFGYFTDFEPVCYRDPETGQHRGYEADLLTALETMTDRDGVRLAFRRVPIDDWPDIWLAPTRPDIDIAGGGITISDDRTTDAGGETVIRFTSGHIGFRQTLLVRSDDAPAIPTHAQLSTRHRVGAVEGTTGEARLLILCGIADHDGVLLPGARVQTPSGEITSDGSPDFTLTAASNPPQLHRRTRILPPDGRGDIPRIVLLGSDDDRYIQALRDGEIDAFARGEIGNTDAAQAADGQFAVTAYDPLVEFAAFTLPADADPLRARIDQRIRFLTDDQRLGYPDWRAEPGIFRRRADRWNRRPDA